MIGFFEFHTYTLFTACADQLLHSLSLIKWFSACVKQNSSKDCNRCFFIVGKIYILWSSGRAREFINHQFWTSYRTFRSFKYFFSLFYLPVLDSTFYKSTILLLPHVRLRSSRQELFCKKVVLRNFAKFTGKCLCRVSFFKKRLWHRCFPVNFAKILRTSFLTEYLRWLLLTFQGESTLHSFRTYCSKQVQYLKFSEQKLHGNATVQT